MSANPMNKFILNSISEFLLLASERPASVFADDTVKNVGPVIVCWDARNFYKNFYRTAATNGDRLADNLPGSDDFASYCESKIGRRFAAVQLTDYRCRMTVSDLMHMASWARFYDRFGPRFVKFLLFECMLFVPVQPPDDVYYCVDSTQSPRAGRHEVLRSFWAKTKRVRVPRPVLATRRSPRYNVASVLPGPSTMTPSRDVDGMLRDVLRTEVGMTIDNGDARFAGLKSKLKTMADKSSNETFAGIYRTVVGSPRPADEVPLSKVKKFAELVVRKTVPRDLFGTDRNRDQYVRNLTKILNCGKFHDYTALHVTYRVRTGRVRWLEQVGDAAAKSALMAKTLVWLTNGFVFDKITRFFWISTTNGPNHGVAYFTRPAWSALCNEKIRPLLRDGFFKQLEDDVPSSKHKSPYRQWKVCPYAKPRRGVRLIFKLRERHADKALMDNCLAFLRGLLCATYAPQYRSVAQHTFFDEWTATVQWSEQRPRLYFVRTDLRDAFTSVKHDKLLTVVRAAIKARFGRQCQDLLVHTVDVVKTTSGRNVYVQRRRFFDGLPTPRFASGSLVFGDRTDTVSLTRMWAFVRRCVQRNAARLPRDRRTFAVTRGIVQGDRLSVTLCDMFLADLQAAHLSEFADCSCCRLYRFVDDYLFVSADLDTAHNFLRVMEAGFLEYGLSLNCAKTETNVDRVGGDAFRFLGLQLDAGTGEATRDETSLRRKRPLHFFDYGLGRGRPGRALLAKIACTDQHRVPAVLVARATNTAATAARNVASVVAYKAFAVVAAVRQYFHAVNQRFLLRTVRRVAEIMYGKIRGMTTVAAVTPTQCVWIVYEVYARLFAKYLPTRTAWTVVQLREKRAVAARKCHTMVLRVALKSYDFTKMFD